ncbi:HEAT repeat domain-containing protein [Lentzea sp.]|uniref:HEAT repeat domain-containing protein n=1 Tax=Lentzea sp. TaxID=56099 RepID=UPI002ED4A48B
MGDIVWSDLTHNYGDASDIPNLLRACADPDADSACDAFADLFNKLYHQGGWVCSAASAALPMLTDLASDSAVHDRHEVVDLIGRLARTAVTVSSEFVDHGWFPALETARPQLLALLDDPDSLVRRQATLLVADGIRHPDSVVALRERWAVETDRVTQIDLVLALGAVCTWTSDETLRAELVGLLNDDDLQLCLAAVHALAESDKTVATRRVDLLVRAVLDPGAALSQDSAWIGGTPATIVRTTGDLLLEDPVAATGFAIGAARDSNPQGRAAALGQAQQVLSRWRTATGGFLPLLTGSLGDDAPEVRYRAAALLACLGTDAAEHADQLITLTADSAPRVSRTRTTVGDAAVWALARQTNPGCLPGLVDRLSGDRLGFSTTRGYFTRDVLMLGQPAICEVLIPLRHHADVLLGPLATRRDLARNLCHVVEAWGLDAVSALPAVVDAAADEKLRALAAKAMGCLGPAAADAARTLLGDVDTPTVAWALWRTGADPDLGLTALTHQLSRPELWPTTIALVGDLGPDAALCADALRALTRSSDEWTRAEAAHSLWQVTGDPTDAVDVLVELAQPLAQGNGLPVRTVALHHLLDIGVTDDRIRSTAQAIIDNPQRITSSGGWRAFTEDEQVRAAAFAVLH